MANRYNQGFGFCGPMEQSKDGKWVKASDYDELSAATNSVVTKLGSHINKLTKWLDVLTVALLSSLVLNIYLLAS